jgi:putative ABC transport system ATP-binding protein
MHVSVSLQETLTTLLNEYSGETERLIEDITTYLREKANTARQLVPKKGKILIQLKNLSKEYKVGKEAVHALKGIDLEIYEGEIVALIGPSGSGKSTILNIVGGLDTPTSGDVFIADKNLKDLKDHELSDYRNHTIGFVFQFFNLQPYLSVVQNVEVPLIFRGATESVRRDAALEAVKNVALEDRATHLPNQLSGGQMQRVAIARSIVNNPKIILADEPTGNLDKKTGTEILNLLKELNKKFNTTIIIVTHDNSVAQQADRIITLQDGNIHS